MWHECIPFDCIGWVIKMLVGSKLGVDREGIMSDFIEFTSNDYFELNDKLKK